MRLYVHTGEYEGQQKPPAERNVEVVSTPCVRVCVYVCVCVCVMGVMSVLSVRAQPHACPLCHDSARA